MLLLHVKTKNRFCRSVSQSSNSSFVYCKEPYRRKEKQTLLSLLYQLRSQVTAKSGSRGFTSSMAREKYTVRREER